MVDASAELRDRLPAFRPPDAQLIAAAGSSRDPGADGSVAAKEPVPYAHVRDQTRVSAERMLVDVLDRSHRAQAVLAAAVHVALHVATSPAVEPEAARAEDAFRASPGHSGVHSVELGVRHATLAGGDGVGIGGVGRADHSDRGGHSGGGNESDEELAHAGCAFR